ncbi:EamA-like transporter family protein [Winogradskyella sediminis]|uniref:EamA-like transporter family protein n=2 Tax=Winogradskyella sediminis TaxID=1382466 RepID=A0A1H1T4W5_9FLAO|nr:DMT family transporter [Winogradskyella sediminis]REG89064.1 EamA-like transporter family protein [Winogradskyella sediminis]SDS55143.1 EamA-like transporter family protein [Winogradskyella sediminis]
MVISALAFTFLNVFVKSLNNFSVYQIVFFRALGSLFFTIPYLLKNKISLLGNKRGLMIMRSIVGLISMSAFFLSIKYIAMGTAVSLRYIAPIFATIFALFVLKEKIRPVQWLFFGIAFTGVLILKGFDDDTEIQFLGVILALTSAVFAGLVYIFIRKIGSADHPVVIVNYFMMVSVIIGGLLSIKNWVHPVGKEWLVLMSLGVFGYFAQLYMTKAMQVGETNQIAPLKYLEVIFTILIGLIWFKEVYTLWSLLGVVLIVLGLTLNVLTKKK